MLVLILLLLGFIFNLLRTIMFFSPSGSIFLVTLSVSPLNNLLFFKIFFFEYSQLFNLWHAFIVLILKLSLLLFTFLNEV